MIHGLEKEAFLLSFNKLFLFSQDNHFIRKSQRTTRLGFNDSEEPYIHNQSVEIQTYCPGFFCVSSSLKDLLSHLLYSFCLIPSHPLNSAVQFPQERVDFICRTAASASIPMASHHCMTLRFTCHQGTVSAQPSPCLGTNSFGLLVPSSSLKHHF